MKYLNKNQKGFTLTELIMVMIILGLLAAVAVPKFFDLSGEANEAAEKGVVGGVRAGIQTYFAKNRAYPGSLDGVAASTACGATAADICFEEVLDQGGITEDWSKNAGGDYVGPNGGVYEYTAASGSFLKL